MDKKKFKEFLTSVAEVAEVKPTKNPSIRQSDDFDDLVRFENNMINISFEDNPTLGFKLVKLKENIKPCELGCGDIVTDQKIEKRLSITPRPHWKTKCMNCGCYVSPDKKGFIHGSVAAQAAFNAFLNKGDK